jgi:hypothetical protein
MLYMRQLVAGRCEDLQPKNIRWLNVLRCDAFIIGTEERYAIDEGLREGINPGTWLGLMECGVRMYHEKK